MINRRNGSLLTATQLAPNNIWSGSAFEYLPAPSFVSIGIITPGTGGGLLSSMYIGGRLIAEEFEVPFSAPTVWGSNQPDLMSQMYIQAGGNAMERLVSTLRNPTGGTLLYTALAIVQPAGGRRR